MPEKNSCHLLKDSVTQSDLNVGLEEIRVAYEDSHWSRRLMRCKDCAQLFAKEFYEEVDWQQGNDAQYSTYTPIDSEADFIQMHKIDTTPLSWRSHIPCICSDWPSDTEQPVLYWKR